MQMDPHIVMDRPRSRPTIRRLALAGILGPPFFVLVFLILGLVKPGYDPVTRFVSEGSIGDLGWVQIANFLILGPALLIFAVGLRLGFGDRLSGQIGSALIAVAGIGIVFAGVFVADPGTQVATTHGGLHIVASLVTFLCLALACFFFARRFWNDLPFAIYSIGSGLIIPIGFSQAGTMGGRWTGIIQRVVIIVVWAWMAVLAIRLRRAST